MSFSAVVINWNDGGRLHQLLDSLRPLTEGIRHLVIVDNHSTPPPEIQFPDSRKVLFLPQDRNLGFAGGLNLGIESTDAEFLLVLNPDILLVSEAVSGLLEELERSPEVAIACPRLIGLDGESQESFQIRSLPTLRSVLSDALFLDELFSVFRRDVTEDEFLEAGPQEVAQPAAACWMLRRKAWEEIGGFDADFHPAWFEDVDFCRRLLEAGWKIVYLPRLEVFHKGGSSLEHLGYPRFLRCYYGNLLRYWRKHHAGTYPIVWVAVRAGLTVRLLLTKVYGHERS